MVGMKSERIQSLNFRLGYRIQDFQKNPAIIMRKKANKLAPEITHTLIGITFSIVP